MKVVALVSGGKDSTFNMMLCAAYGHEVVAMANLFPPGEAVGGAGPAGTGACEEMDSFMYQTAGHALIPMLAECAGLPLFRQPINGSAVQTGLEYFAPAAPRAGSAAAGAPPGGRADEVEDLLALLQAVLAAHPDVRGVSVGAIASDYQRIRVESVCARLGLTALAYLWRQEQAALLDRMLAAGVDAVLCKVACLGLSPRAHLGRSLAEVRPKLLELHASFGCHVCGEGGEYETMTRWCPLFASRMQLGGMSAHVLDEGGGFAPVAVLRVGEVSSVPVEPAERESWPPVERAPAAALLELAGGEGGGARAARPAWAAVARGADGDTGALLVCAHAVGCWLSVSVSVPDGAAAAGLSGAERAAEAVTSALRAAAAELHARGSAGLSDALLLKLYLGDMAHYAAANAAFGAALAGCAPAARAAVGVPLSSVGAVLRLEVLARRAAQPHTRTAAEGARRVAHKRVLHVQSVSEWAPRMIGPYAQAAWVAAPAASAEGDADEPVGGVREPPPTLCCLAGSLGLHPPTMALVPGGAAPQAAQALANVDAVLDALGRTAQDALSATLFSAEGATPHEELAGAHGGCAGATRQLLAWAVAAALASGRPLPLRATLRVDALPMGALAEALVDTMGRDTGGAGAGEVRSAGLEASAGWRWREAEERVALLPDHGAAAEEHGGAGRAELVVRALWREAAEGARSAPLGLAQLWAYVVWRPSGGALQAEPGARRVPLGRLLPAVAAAAGRLARASGEGSPPLLPLHVSVAYTTALGPGAEEVMRAPAVSWPCAPGETGCAPSVAFVPVRQVVEPADCCAVVSVLLACPW